jgi:tRNA-2-methylthio-N6-dimethylallyladenosine synthase
VFEGNERLVGRTVRVAVEEATAFTLFGTVVTGEQVGVDEAVPRPEVVRERIPLPLL